MSPEQSGDEQILAEVHQEEVGLIGRLKIGTKEQPLIFEPVGEHPNAPTRINAVWRILHELNEQIRNSHCIDDMEGQSQTVQFPITPKVLVIAQRIIQRMGAGRVKMKWIFSNMERHGHLLKIPVRPQPGQT